MLGTSNELITTTLRDYGAVEDGIRLFDWDGAHLLGYATLIAARRAQDGELKALCGIYEWQQQPLAFLVDGQLVEDNQQFLRIRRLLAMRGDAPYLCVVDGGKLTVFRVGLDNTSTAGSQVQLPPATETSLVLPYLSNVRPGLAARRRWIEQVVLSLLDDAITKLIRKCNISNGNAVSLVGRALFVRFLADRGLLSDADALRIAAVQTEQVFDSQQATSCISDWLDTTFNGDLLPVDAQVLHRLPKDAFVILGHILHKAPGGQRMLPWAESWANLDFAYIPVGVLSQAYEHYLRLHAPEAQEKEGGFYTPAIIAQMMLRGAMHALRAEGKAHIAKVLDPAAGAGVFLVSTFRQLVAERWAHDGTRPTTKILREILYEQIAGFDINEEALRFAALGLYLMSIELDPDPLPIQKLRFEKNLRDRVLFKVGEHGSAGSLGRAVEASHDGKYDILIGNPPWSSSTGMQEWDQVLERVKAVADVRLEGTNFEPVLPNEVLDLPFVWAAMRWCRPGGQIAFALHARLLFQQGDRMPEARNAIFSALDITGIVNGADLRNSRVWPDVGAPFCLLFARNAGPTAASRFKFVSPRREDRLNAAGVFRLDATGAPMLTASEVIERPEILKILYRGGSLDLELLGRTRIQQSTSIDAYWRTLGERAGKAQWSGNGYQLLRKSSQANGKNDEGRGVSADHLLGLPNLVAIRHLPPLLKSEMLPVFDKPRLHRARSPDLFKGPLLLVHQSPPAHSRRLNVAVCDDDVVFSESFYGYSAHKHVKGHLLVRYMALVAGSMPALWHSLITSGKFGFEREVVEKITIDSMRIPLFESLDEADVGMVEKLFDRVASSNSEAAWQAVDGWVAKLYGFKEQDIQVIADTLEFASPFASSREAAQLRPTQPQIDQFLVTLTAALNPLVSRYGRQVSAHQVRLPLERTWFMFRLATESSPATAEQVVFEPFLELADRLGTTEVVAPFDKGELVIARLDQARYWTATEARLLARRVVWEHLQHLLGKGQ